MSRWLTQETCPKREWKRSISWKTVNYDYFTYQFKISFVKDYVLRIEQPKDRITAFLTQFLISHSWIIWYFKLDLYKHSWELIKKLKLNGFT